VNRHFQAKWVKSKIMHIIETTAPISTKFCTMMKDHQMLFVSGPNVHNKSKMVDSRIEQNAKSLYRSSRLTDCREI